MPFLREKKHLQGEADYHGKAGREIKLIARSDDVTKRRANKLTDSCFFYGRKRGRSSNFQVESKLRHFVQGFGRRKSVLVGENLAGSCR